MNNRRHTHAALKILAMFLIFIVMLVIIAYAGDQILDMIEGHEIAIVARTCDNLDRRYSNFGSKG